MVSLYPGQKANQLANEAKERYERKLEQLKQAEQATNVFAQEYGELQLNAIRSTIKRFVTFLENTGRKASESEKRIFQGIEILVQPIEYEDSVPETEEIKNYLEGGVKIAAKAAQIGGAPMLAWLGGGALAAGGGGVALGAVVLGGAAILPALAIGSLLFSQKNAESAEHEAKLNQAITDIKSATKFAEEIKQRIIELRDTLKSLNSRAVEGLNQLESQPFDATRDAEKFQQVALLMKGLVEILKTPVMNSEGKINLGTVTILEKYRSLPGK
jgi:hypothetical protein